MSDIGIRIQQARKAAGLSLRTLAGRVSLSHAAIKKYEDGVVYPSSDTLIRLARALKVRVDFFLRPVKVTLEEVKFRKRKKLRGKAEGAIKFEVMNQVERRLELENLYPKSPVPLFSRPASFPKRISCFDEIEGMAETLREQWKLGIAPIHDLIDAFESQGVRVFTLDSTAESFDGLSTLINDQPIIVISSKWPGDRQRFNLCHELAHYLFFDRLDLQLNEEQACNRFAGAFLFPREAVIHYVGKKRKAIEWQELLVLKEQFQLSMGAICYRLKDLDVIQDSYFKSLMILFRRRGWHREEPGIEIPSEKAHTFRQMLFHALGEGYVGESKAAELLSCTIDQLRSLRRVQDSHASTRF